MKLNRATVRKTDEKFYKSHPEMIKDGKRVPLDPKNPAHKGMIREWNQSYKQNSTPPASKTSAPTKRSAKHTPGKTVAPCPNQKQGNTPPPPPCCFKAVTIKCGHGKRNYIMNLPLSPTAIKKGETELHVIAGHTRADNITITLKGGPCNQGQPDLPKLATVSHDGKTLTTQSTTILKAFAPARSVFDIRTQWRSLIWPDVTTDFLSYPVSASACQGAEGCSTSIKAFPYVKWKIAASFGYPVFGKPTVFGIKNKKKESGFAGDSKAYIEHSRRTSEWSFKPPNVTLQLDKGDSESCTTTELGAEFESYIKHTLTLFQNFKDCSDVAGGFISSMGGPEWSVKYPVVELSYDTETVEIEGTPWVGVKGTASLSFTPFIGVEFSYDVLNWLIGMANLYAPGLGTALIKIKKRAEGGFWKKRAKVELSLKFTMSGTIEGSMSWEKPKPAVTKWTPGGELAGKIDGSFVGKAEGSVDVWFISIGGGIEAGGKTGISATFNATSEDDGLYGQGKLGFAGVIIYWTRYASVGRVTKEPKDDDEPDDKPTYEYEKDVEEETKGQHGGTDEYKLVDDAEWPKGDVGKFRIISNS